MASAFRINLTGDRRLQSALKQLDRRAEKNSIKRAVRKEATKVRRAIKSHTPVGATRRLRRSVAKREKNYGSLFMIVVGPDYGIGPHAHLVEEGTKPRYRQVTSDTDTARPGYTGIMPAQHFQRRAWESVAVSVRSRMVTNLSEEINREITKAGTGGGYERRRG